MILADENIPFEITLQDIIQALIYLLKTQTLQRPFFATITTKKIRVRQL
jgi:hypothetical protein